MNKAESKLGNLFKVVACRGNPDLFGKVLNSLQQNQNELEFGNFKDGESYIKFHFDPANKKIILLQSLGRPVNESLMELLLAITALKRNGAEKISVFLTYTAYMRQDRPLKDFKAISGADVIQMIGNAGANAIYTFDIHSEQLLGAAPYTVHMKNLETYPLIEEILDHIKLEKLAIVSPDIGGIKRCKNFIQYIKEKRKIDLPLAIVDKTRKQANEVDSVQVLVGEIKDRDCLLIDDIMDTGNTLFFVADQMKHLGALSIFAYATHGIFSDPSFYENLQKSSFTNIFVSDSLASPNPEKESLSKVRRISLLRTITQFIEQSFCS